MRRGVSLAFRAALFGALVVLATSGAARAQFVPDVPPFTPADPTLGRPFDRIQPGPYGDPSLSRQGPLAQPHPMFRQPAPVYPPFQAQTLDPAAPAAGSPAAPALRGLAAPRGAISRIPSLQTVQKQGDADADALVRAPADVGKRLAACWRPPASQSRVEATLRIAFTRAGGVAGRPMVTYVYAGDAQTRQAARVSALAAAADCAPLRLAPGVGSAIAGRIFAIRLIAFPKGRQSDL